MTQPNNNLANSGEKKIIVSKRNINEIINFKSNFIGNVYPILKSCFDDDEKSTFRETPYSNSKIALTLKRL